MAGVPPPGGGVRLCGAVPGGKETVTGIGHEPWHFRYVGVPHAAVMAENGLTLEEYLPFLQQYIHGERACVTAAAAGAKSLCRISRPGRTVPPG